MLIKNSSFSSFDLSGFTSKVDENKLSSSEMLPFNAEVDTISKDGNLKFFNNLSTISFFVAFTFFSLTFSSRLSILLSTKII